MTERVFVGLGSNIGDREKYLRSAVEGLPDVVAVSSVYETEPVGGPDGQGAYLNCVVELTTALSPAQLHDITRSLESDAGRERRVQWEARTLDVDILLFGSLIQDDAELTIPHPRMRERKFVLAPLQELAPELVDDDEINSGVGEIFRVIPIGDVL